MDNKQKLELTWIGKGEEPKLEPRILIEDSEKSYGDKNTENMLIHGDNLLALKALEQEYAGRVKCIYIDPPFNTGAAFDNYDDNMEHSIWLSLMRQRLRILFNLLCKDGTIYVHIDDKEMAYLKIVMDEVFSRENFLNMIVIKTSDPSGHKTVNPSPYSQTEYLLMYTKDRNCYKYETQYILSNYDNMYGRIVTNKYQNYKDWEIESLSEYLARELGFENSKEAKATIGKLDFEAKKAEYALNNADRVFQPTAISNAAGRNIVEIREASKSNLGKVYCVRRDEYEDVYILDGRQMYFYSSKVKEIEGYKTPAKPLTNLWTDIPWNGIAKEGTVVFKNGKKPEKLLKRCIEISTRRGDYVLDSFLGSGTTAAVAHKMNRKWIGIELGDHCDTHCLPRLKMVCDGTDQGGISKAVGWKGGGGFRYYNLAPSLLKQDKYGNWIIDERYNADMLAAALAKQENFTYCPDETIYWKQGRSTEKDYLFTTTAFMTVERLDKIHEEMQPDESLLICCKSFQSECEDRFSNITIKKIPKMLLGRCEFGKDDYSLNIISMPVDPNEPEFVPQGMKNIIGGTKKKTVVNDTGDLFENGDNGGEDE
ncbi:MAG: site-specific DNA-methyltransferase [Clostridiales bacterium]